MQVRDVVCYKKHLKKLLSLLLLPPPLLYHCVVMREDLFFEFLNDWLAVILAAAKFE